MKASAVGCGTLATSSSTKLVGTAAWAEETRTTAARAASVATQPWREGVFATGNSLCRSSHGSARKVVEARDYMCRRVRTSAGDGRFPFMPGGWAFLSAARGALAPLEVPPRSAFKVTVERMLLY